MITCKIEINGVAIVTVHAVRTDGEPGELCTYECFIMRGDIYQRPEKIVLGTIKHFYDDGAEELSKKMLDYFKVYKGKSV
jgi:hypothetical protein